MHPPRRLLAVLACAAASHAAWADRSKLDEEGAVERGDCELELQRERKTVRGEPSELGSSVQLGCGIGLRTELIVAVARQGSGSARDDSFDFEAHTWLGRVGGLGWTLELGASRERESGRRWHLAEHAAALVAAYPPSETWVFEAKLGTVRDRIQRRRTTVWELAVEHEVFDPFVVRAALEGNDRRGRPFATIELHYEIWPDRARVNLSCGGRSGAAHERLLGVGVTFEF